MSAKSVSMLQIHRRMAHTNCEKCHDNIWLECDEGEMNLMEPQYTSNIKLYLTHRRNHIRNAKTNLSCSSKYVARFDLGFIITQNVPSFCYGAKPHSDTFVRMKIKREYKRRL